MTNYEKIKSMSIDEIIKFLLCDLEFPCDKCSHNKTCVTTNYDQCKDALKNWLKSESEED